MPWCDDCARYLTPTSLGAGGECPSCDRVVADPPKPPRAPWHFKLLLLALTAYLGLRAVQGVAWVADRL